MTSMLEIPASALPEQPPRIGIEGKNPTLQYQMLGDPLEYQTKHITDKQTLSRALLEFGADEASSSSVMVRAFAIERAVCTIQQLAADGEELPEDLRRLHDFTRIHIPEYADSTVRYAIRQHGDRNAHLPYWGAHDWVWGNLAQQEGILAGVVFDDGMGPGGSAEAVNSVPVAVGLLLDRNVDPSGQKIGASRGIAPQFMGDAVRLTVDQCSAVYRGEEWQPAPEDERLLQFLRLGRFIDLRKEAPNFEHDGPAEYLYASAKGEQYAEALNRLYEVAPRVAKLFPVANSEAVSQDFRGLTASVMFALEYFVAHDNNIDVTIPGPNGKPTRIQEKDPLALIKALEQAIVVADEDSNGRQTTPVFEAVDDNFSTCRFVPHDVSKQPRVSYFGRAERTATHNSAYEFSADPTLRYRVQLDGDAPISLLNSEQTANTVGLRVDSDKFGVALDVGAFSDNPYTHNDSDLEVRIGRFVALGNWLRSQITGNRPTYHHIRSLNAVMAEKDVTTAVRRREQQLRGMDAPLAVGALATTRH